MPKPRNGGGRERVEIRAVRRRQTHTGGRRGRVLARVPGRPTEGHVTGGPLVVQPPSRRGRPSHLHDRRPAASLWTENRQKLRTNNCDFKMVQDATFSSCPLARSMTIQQRRGESAYPSGIYEEKENTSIVRQARRNPTCRTSCGGAGTS